jgi:hypothetical protein
MGNTTIIETDGTTEDVARWIWQKLVPKSGQADTVQGELLRAIEKLRWEAQENGNINWDDCFEMFVDFLQRTLCSEAVFSQETRDSIVADLHRLRTSVPPNKLEDGSQIPELPYTDDDLYDRLTGHVVAFCREHREPMPLEVNPEQYR